MSYGRSPAYQSRRGLSLSPYTVFYRTELFCAGALSQSLNPLWPIAPGAFFFYFYFFLSQGSGGLAGVWVRIAA